MPELAFPRQRVGSIQELAARLLDSRKVGTKLETLARDLLAGFHDLCLRSGLDRVLVELGQAFPALDVSDRSGLSDHETLFPALVAQLGAIDIDGGGPRNAKPPQLADCVVKALGLTLVDEADRTIALEDAVRSEVVSAMSSVVDGELAVPRIREAIIAKGRELRGALPRRVRPARGAPRRARAAHAQATESPARRGPGGAAGVVRGA